MDSHADNTRLLTADLKPMFPHFFGRNEIVPLDMIGATILGIGMMDTKGFDDNLVIDYRPKSATEIRRIVLGYGDTGIWSVANLLRASSATST